MPKKNKTLCVDDLRHAEYYGMQPVFDELYQEQDTDGKESGGLQLHGRGTGIDTHEPKYELICSIRFEESTVYGAKHRTY